jgi:AcrR family transcriptional regulator
VPSRAVASSKRKHDLAARRAESARRGDDPVRATLMEAMLSAVGELGYREVAIEQVLERCDGHRVQFWERFAGKEECFEAAYRDAMDRLVAEILAAALAEEEWRLQVRAGVVAFLGFVAAEPDVARALLVEVEVAGGAALAKREETIERLGEALDSVREQLPAAERPPPLTGLFVAGGIAGYAGEWLAAGEPATVWQGLPELIRFATGPYLGEAAAAAEFEAARELLACR